MNDVKQYRTEGYKKRQSEGLNILRPVSFEARRPSVIQVIPAIESEDSSGRMKV